VELKQKLGAVGNFEVVLVVDATSLFGALKMRKREWRVRKRVVFTDIIHKRKVRKCQGLANMTS
jgi:hypothetical protein